MIFLKVETQQQKGIIPCTASTPYSLRIWIMDLHVSPVVRLEGLEGRFGGVHTWGTSASGWWRM